MNADVWRARGAFYQIFGQQIFVIDHQHSQQDVVFVLHGYPSASIDYYKCLQFFRSHRVVIPDHMGFGFSDKPKSASYLLTYQADVVIELCQRLGIRRAHFLTHDYGTSIATELLARHQESELSIEILSCTLCNGSMLIDLAQLRPIQRLLKNKWIGPLVAHLATKRTFARNMKKIFYDPSKIEDREIDVLWSLLLGNGGRRVLSTITRYIDQRFQFYRRWIGSLQQTSLPIFILWGKNDPVAVVEMAHRLNRMIPNSKLTLLHNVGHYPMLEAPKEWSEAVLDFLKSLD